jgi:hypothetical protein
MMKRVLIQMTNPLMGLKKKSLKKMVTTSKK